MAAIKMFQFGFFGSFQCRLATDPDPTGALTESSGWTYDLGEVGFDRIIRLSAPVSPRTGMIDHPWANTKVNGIQTDTGGGLKPVPSSDPFLGQVVSFGSKVVFDSKAGGGSTKEAILNFEFSAGSMFKATAPKPPQISTTVPNASEGPRFDKAKQAFGATLAAGARATSYANSSGAWAAFYQMMGTVDNVPLDTPTIKASGGSLKDVAALISTKAAAAKSKWVIHIDFYHFDGDTLCGDCNGWVTGTF